MAYQQEAPHMSSCRDTRPRTIRSLNAEQHTELKARLAEEPTEAEELSPEVAKLLDERMAEARGRTRTPATSDRGSHCVCEASLK
jgi:hypothetical protein